MNKEKCRPWNRRLNRHQKRRTTRKNGKTNTENWNMDHKKTYDSDNAFQ